MRRTPSYPLTSVPWRLRVAEAQPLQSDAVPETSYPSRWSAFSCIARSVPSGQLFYEEVSECENGRGFREGCPCEDRFVGVMERRRGPCDAVELDDELFGRHRDAGAARRRQTELQVVSVQRRIEARDRDGELLSATRATPEKLSTLRRLHINWQFVSPHQAATSNGFGHGDMYSGHVGTHACDTTSAKEAPAVNRGLVGNVGKAARPPG